MHPVLLLVQDLVRGRDLTCSANVPGATVGIASSQSLERNGDVRRTSRILARGQSLRPARGKYGLLLVSPSRFLRSLLVLPLLPRPASRSAQPIAPLAYCCSLLCRRNAILSASLAVTAARTPDTAG